MATQIVLSLEHILVDIFDNLAGTIPTFLEAFLYPPDKLCDDEWIRQKTLVSAALTCRAFSEPASRVIWSSLHRTGFAPLLQVYRRMGKNHCGANTPPGAVHATTELSQRQWERFEHVAARVRYVVYDMHRDKNILPSLLARYEQTDRALFPNLRILAWTTSRSVDDMRWLRMLASPSALISALYCKLYQPGTSHWTIELRMFIDRYRHSLRKLGWDVYNHNDSLVSMLPLLAELQHIEIYHLSSSILAALPSLPKLEVLTVHRIHGSSLLGSNTIVPHALQELHLTGVFSSQLSPLFDSLTCPRLRALSVTCEIDTKISDGAERQLGEIFTHSLVRQLATLDLRLYYMLDTSPPFAAILPLLLSLPIRSFSIITGAPVFVTSQELELIACTWPLLSSFELVLSMLTFDPLVVPLPPPPLLPSSLPSLSSVLTFVRACRALRVFAIERIQDVSAEELAIVEEMCRPSDTEHAPQTNLEYLEFVGIDCDWRQEVKISDPARLARILRRSFPRLRQLGPSKMREERYGPWTDRRELQECFHKLLQEG